MKSVSIKKLEKATEKIKKMVEAGNSFTYSKFVTCRELNIPTSQAYRFQSLESYLSLRKAYIILNRNKKRYVKEAL